MTERIDIYDANLEPMGTMDRVQAHHDGRWHQTLHCWVITANDGGAILFQLRSPEMQNFPGALDVSAAGHLEAGESVADGMREVSEELGLRPAEEDVHFLGYRVEVADQTNGQRNREYQAVHLARCDLALSEYRPQLEEITGLVWLGVGDALALFSGKEPSAVVWGVQHGLNEMGHGEWEAIRKTVTIKDFLPRIQNYYLTIAIMTERLLQGHLPLAIS